MRKLRSSSPRKEQEAEVVRVLELLHRWGIHSLGELAQLNREAVGNRLGRMGVELWDRARGKSRRLLHLVSSPESFDEAFEFESEIETIEPLLFILRRFLQQLSVRLSSLYLVASELRLEITFSDKSIYQHHFTIPQATNQVEILFRILHTHLENYQSEFPIIAVGLKAEAIKPSFQQFNLFETALRDPTRLSETLDRLTGLLGADRVGRPILEETYRPDAFRMEPFTWQFPDRNQDEVSRLPATRLRRFRLPVSASVLLVKNRPAHLRSAELSAEVVQRKGPYKISGDWWDEKSWTRAEWDLELKNGALCQCHSDKGKWKLDGIYD